MNLALEEVRAKRMNRPKALLKLPAYLSRLKIWILRPGQPLNCIFKNRLPRLAADLPDNVVSRNAGNVVRQRMNCAASKPEYGGDRYDPGHPAHDIAPVTTTAPQYTSW
jgi:hypothetical protein